MIVRRATIASLLLVLLVVSSVQPVVLMNAVDSGYASAEVHRKFILWPLWGSAIVSL